MKPTTRTLIDHAYTGPLTSYTITRHAYLRLPFTNRVNGYTVGWDRVLLQLIMGWK